MTQEELKISNDEKSFLIDFNAEENVSASDFELVNEFESDSKSQTKKEVRIKLEKENVSSYDIFKLAKGILFFATGIFLLLALIRIFYTYNGEGIKEVWDYSKVILNSIVSLVLGLYFGSKEAQKGS